MNLGKYLVSEILSEETSNIKRIVVVYPGRFQPMGRHHAEVYKAMTKKFGEDNTFVVTSDKVSLPKSPLNFNEKKSVANKHGIKNIIKAKNPYSPVELTSELDPTNTALLFVVGAKDMQDDPRFRVGYKKSGDPTYFQSYEENKGQLQPFDKHGYLVVAPHIKIDIPGHSEMSGTALRQVLATADPKTFEEVMGWYDKKIFSMLRDKFSSVVEQALTEFISFVNFKDLIFESSAVQGSKADVDDGPRYFYGNQKTYKAKTAEMAEKLGYQVLNYIVTGNEFTDHKTMFPDGPPLSVSYFPVGRKGGEYAGTYYSKEYKGTKAWSKWANYIKTVAQRVGYKLIDYLGAEQSADSSKDEDMKPTTLRESIFTKHWWSKIIKEEILTEGGASGHLSHPYDDRELTFNELKEMVNLALSGKLDIETAVQEKTDGQNLNVTFKDGKVRAARNKSTIINPMDIDEVKSKFEGRGEISDAFTYAMKDLENAILQLPEETRNEIFQNGSRFINLEIIYPSTSNVITYGPDAYLQFHGLNEFDLTTATKTRALPEYGKKLQQLIQSVNADTQEHFKIIPPKFLELNKLPDFDERQPYYIQKINTLQKQFNLSDSDTIGDWHTQWWSQYIDNKLNDIDDSIKKQLINRWANNDKSFRLNLKNIPDSDLLSKVKEIDSNVKSLDRKNIENFENIFLELGAEVLSNINTFLAANPAESVKQLRKSIADTIKYIRNTNDPDALDKLKTQLRKIEKLGGFEKIVPTEGLVFVYKGGTYKLTGAFAPINQLLGIMRYSR